MYISDKQKLAIETIIAVGKEFGFDRWFVQSEIPNITLHSMDALVDKKILDFKKSEATGHIYYCLNKDMLSRSSEFSCFVKRGNRWHMEI